MKLDETLRPLFRQLASNPSVGIVFGATEVARWPTGFLESLENSRVIEAGSPAESVICPGCPRACVLGVAFDGCNGILKCDQIDVDYGLIDVEAAELRQWQASRSRLVAFVARELSLSPDERNDGAARVRLGTWRSGRVRRAASLEFSSRVVLRIGDDDIDLADVVKCDGARLRVDKAELEARAMWSADPQVGGKRYQTSRAKQRHAAQLTLLRNRRLQTMADQLKEANPKWKKVAIANAILKSKEFIQMNMRIKKATTLERIIRVPRK